MVIIQLWQEKMTLAKGFKIPIMMKGNRVKWQELSPEAELDNAKTKLN